MKKTIILFMAIYSILVMCSCSITGKLLEKIGMGELNEKLDAAWNEIGKDMIAEMTDDMWREFGFGKNIDWPETGIGSKLPKLREGTVETCYTSDYGGYIKVKGISDKEFDEYKLKYSELGFKTQIDKTSFSAVLVFDGLYVGFSHEKSLLVICYADSTENLDIIKNGGGNPLVPLT